MAQPLDQANAAQPYGQLSAAMAAALVACTAVAAHPGPLDLAFANVQLLQQLLNGQAQAAAQAAAHLAAAQAQVAVLAGAAGAAGAGVAAGAAGAAAGAAGAQAALTLNARLVNLERIGALTFNWKAGDGAQYAYVAVPNASGLAQPANMPPISSRADLVGLGEADLVQWCLHYDHALPANTTHEERRRVIARSMGLNLGPNVCDGAAVYSTVCG